MWLVKNAIFDLPIRLIRNSKSVSGNSLSSLRAQNKYFDAASRTLLTKTQAMFLLMSSSPVTFYIMFISFNERNNQTIFQSQTFGVFLKEVNW